MRIILEITGDKETIEGFVSDTISDATACDDDISIVRYNSGEDINYICPLCGSDV